MGLAGGENFVALDLIVQHVHSQLEKVGNMQLWSFQPSKRWELVLLWVLEESLSSMCSFFHLCHQREPMLLGGDVKMSWGAFYNAKPLRA